MWVSLFTIHFMLLNVQGYYTDETETDPTSETPDTVYKSRCTRRYTPGVCEEPAASVWTFAFHLQNCTEKLGCAVSHRTNRFRSYKQCMRRCRPLIDIYLQILANDNYTQILYLRDHPDIAGRREGDSNLIDLTDTQLDVADEDKDEEAPTEEPLFNLYYRDDPEVEVSLPPDIDYVGQREEELPSDYLYED